MSIQSYKIFHQHLHTGMSKWNNFFWGKIIITWLCCCWGVLTLSVTEITIFSALCALFLPDPSWTISNHLADHLNYTLSPKDLIFFLFLSFLHFAKPVQSKHKPVLKLQSYFPQDPAREIYKFFHFGITV